MHMHEEVYWEWNTAEWGGWECTIISKVAAHVADSAQDCDCTSRLPIALLYRKLSGAGTVLIAPLEDATIRDIGVLRKLNFPAYYSVTVLPDLTTLHQFLQDILVSATDIAAADYLLHLDPITFKHTGHACSRKPSTKLSDTLALVPPY